MSDSMVFRGGLPFAPDVKRLEEAFPVDSLAEGRIIGHERLETIVQAKRGTGRYYGVINSWIHRLRNVNGVFVVWQQGDGIKVLNPAEILDHAELRTRQKIRQTGRAVKTFAWVDRTRLDETGQRRLDHQMRIVGAMKDSLDQAKRQLAVELAPVHSLPKRKISA